jgi:hypothetical protein
MVSKTRLGQGIQITVWKDLRSDNVNSLPPAGRWIRIALKLLISDCPYRPVLCISPGNPFTDRQVAKNLRVSLKAWRAVKTKLLEWGEIEILPEVGLRFTDWKGHKGTKYETMAIAQEVAPASEQELRLTEGVRGRLAETYNTICGTAHNPLELLFVKNVSARIAEGATEQDLDIGMRTYVWAYMNGTPSLITRMAPFGAFKSHSFWKWVKMNRPAARLRAFSTIEYVRTLSPRLRKIARGIASGYHSDMKLVLRKNGWDHLYDVDWDKVMTCKQYVQTRLVQEGSFEANATDV